MAARFGIFGNDPFHRIVRRHPININVFLFCKNYPKVTPIKGYLVGAETLWE
jgi:hypothetical protein